MNCSDCKPFVKFFPLTAYITLTQKRQGCVSFMFNIRFIPHSLKQAVKWRNDGHDN